MTEDNKPDSNVQPFTGARTVIRKLDEATEARLRQKMQDQMARAREFGEQAPARFLAAWVRGVKMVGPECFGFQQPMCGDILQPAKTLDEVTSKWQVYPILHVIKKSLGVKSSGERALAAIMYSFYNSEDGAKLMRKVGLRGFADISNSLDLDAREVVSDLLLYHTGW
jgi:hypothetical protein